MMGYSNGYIASIIFKNKPLREFKYNGKRTVKVPFGSEYVIRLKNKSKDPALVEVSIDGTDVLNGSELVLDAGKTIDLERFVENNESGKKFKYISLEEGASSGDIDDPYREENGLVQVNFYKAFQLPMTNYTHTTCPSYYPFCGAVVNHDYLLKSEPLRTNEPVFGSNITVSDSVIGAAINCTRPITETAFFSSVIPDSDTTTELSSDKGATVEGSDSDQSFTSTSEYFKLGSTPTCIDIFMVGPNYVSKEAPSEWGVYIGKAEEPVATFKEKKHAHLFAGSVDLGKVSITVKETD